MKLEDGIDWTILVHFSQQMQCSILEYREMETMLFKF